VLKIAVTVIAKELLRGTYCSERCDEPTALTLECLIRIVPNDIDRTG
jgi:hypothetical protein